ncbi:UNVERIFIED_CONTAM: hypothetical protein FKN15_064357 [Acipenser sinensis]
MDLPLAQAAVSPGLEQFPETSERQPLPVVIIGNGPSAICLSYFLSGHRPYVRKGAFHPNPILQRKLQDIAGSSVVEQPLLASSAEKDRVEPLTTSRKLYEIQGFHQTAAGLQSSFCIHAENVVLATGTYDSPAWLGADGEDLPYVFHKISDLETALQKQRLGPDSDPVLIFGAGLTAADAVLTARHSNVPVIHTFRRAVSDSGLVFNQLPKMMYPEYHKVHQMMTEQSLTSSGPYKGYSSLPKHRVARFSTDKKCVLEDASGKRTVFNISMAFVLIGSNPNLSFLPSHGKHLALDPEQPVNSRRNPIDTDPFTYESVQEPGLYALGPLAGDSFVRFLQGGALAVTASLLKKRNVDFNGLTIESL